MKYDFNKKIDRMGTLSYKWEGIPVEFPENPKALPFWIADMEFACPEPIVKAVCERARHPIYGYSHESDDAKALTASWLKRRHEWDVQSEWVTFSGGVVPGLIAMMKAVTQPGDKVILQPPVYYPLFEMIRDNGRIIVENPLVYDGSQWVMNVEELEILASDPEVTLFVLCNPHNPVSRAFTARELERLGDICLRNGVKIASDEIHADIVYKGNRHTPIASLSKELAEITMTSLSPSKTFNIAGLQISAGIIPNTDLLVKVEAELANAQYIVNLFGAVGLKAAYQDPECEAYLEQMLVYLWGNYEFVNTYLKNNMPKIRCQRPEATYLIWLDCHALGLSDAELLRFFLVNAGVALDPGSVFGTQGKGYMRLNIACPREMLKICLDRLTKAYHAL